MPYTRQGWQILLPTDPRVVTWRLPMNDSADPGKDYDVLNLRIVQGSRGLNLAHLAMRIDSRIEDVDHSPGVRDDWGHALRVVRGYRAVWSEHGAGCAIDLNALQHGLGRVGTWSPEEKAKIDRWLNGIYDGAITWGEHFRTRVDGMHFESSKGMARQERVAKHLLTTPLGRRLIEFNPAQRAVIYAP